MAIRNYRKSLRLDRLEARDVPTAYHWTGADPSPNWNVANNWINETTNTVNGFPNATSDIARFLPRTGDETILIPGGVSITVAAIEFDDLDDTYSIINSGTGQLTLENTNATTGVKVTVTGSHLLSMPVLIDDTIVEFDVNFGGLLTTLGAFTTTTGPIPALKSGDGRLRFGGSGTNHFSELDVDAGVVESNKSSGEIVSSGVILIGNNVTSGSAIFRTLSANDIGDAVAVQVRPNGQFELNNVSDTIAALDLFATSVTAGRVTTGTGTLSITGSVTQDALEPNPKPANISGRLDLSAGVPQFAIADGSLLDITADLSGTVGFAKVGAGTLRLSGNTTLSGGISLIGGKLIADTSMPNATVNIVAGTLEAKGSIEGVNASTPEAVFAPGIGGPGLVTLFNGLSLSAGTTLEFDVNGPSPGSQRDALGVNGTVEVTNAVLSMLGGNVVTDSTSLVIISNDGTDPVVGAFAGLPEGAIVKAGSQPFQITYTGGDGNDVQLLPLPLAVTVAPGGATATFVDVDGDLVTVRTSRGAFDGTEFIGVTTGDAGAGQLAALNLDADFTGANISITARRVAGGNGLVNVGFINAAGVDLGAVTVRGDLARIFAGTAGGDAKVPAISSLAAQSLGLLGTANLLPGADLLSIVQGAVPRLTVSGDFRSTLVINGATDGRLGTAIIGGSITSDNPQTIFAQAGIGSLRISGDIRNRIAFTDIRTNGAIGSVFVGGSISGVGQQVQIRAVGQLTPPTSGLDLAIGSVDVRGSIEGALIQAGVTGTGNRDASIGSIKVGGDWIASIAHAATSVGSDLRFGTNDDDRVSSSRDNPALFSTIGRIAIKGQALGTAAAGDTFGIIAERIGKAKVGGRTFAFTPAAAEGFFAAPTGPGATGLSSDFTIREIGSVTANIAPTPDLSISADGKTATFTDVDGDLVKVRRNRGTFDTADFLFENPSNGAGLRFLDLSFEVPGKQGLDLSISARPGPLGGNGFVNIDLIDATLTDLGVVTVAGDLLRLFAGNSDQATPAAKSIRVHSIGAIPGSPPGQHTFSGTVPSFTVATDFRRAILSVSPITTPTFPALGRAVIGGSLVGDTGSGAVIASPFGIGSLTIGGSIRANGTSTHIESQLRQIGSLTIGGDVVGTADSPVIISARGQAPGTARGQDVAIGRLVVKGSVEYAHIVAGDGKNADASIGAVVVGRNWLASNLVAGVTSGSDGVFGIDDAKLAGPGVTDEDDLSSRIGSVRIGGQAIGSPSVGDHFGIVAESIGLVSIGGVAIRTTSDKDDFLISETGDFRVLEV